jgi:hypothetical protein
VIDDVSIKKKYNISHTIVSSKYNIYNIINLFHKFLLIEENKSLF